MQTIHVPMSLCNSTLVLQFEENLPPQLQRIDAQKYSSTVKEVNRILVSGSARYVALAYLVVILVATAVMVWSVTEGNMVGYYVFFGLYIAATIPFLIYAVYMRNKMTTELTQFLASENLYYQSFGLSFVYQSMAMVMCGQSQLQIVDTSAVMQTQPQYHPQPAYAPLTQQQPAYLTSYAATASPYVTSAQTSYTPIAQQGTRTAYY